MQEYISVVEKMGAFVYLRQMDGCSVSEKQSCMLEKQ